MINNNQHQQVNVYFKVNHRFSLQVMGMIASEKVVFASLQCMIPVLMCCLDTQFCQLRIRLNFWPRETLTSKESSKKKSESSSESEITILTDSDVVSQSKASRWYLFLLQLGEGRYFGVILIKAQKQATKLNCLLQLTLFTELGLLHDLSSVGRPLQSWP